MNKKLPLRSLAENVSNRTGIEFESSQTFVKTMFNLVGEQLLHGEVVAINGIGEFSSSHNPEEPIRFTVDPLLFDELNAPFSMFNSVDIPIDIDYKELIDLSNESSEKSEIQTEDIEESTISNEFPSENIDTAKSEEVVDVVAPIQSEEIEPLVNSENVSQEPEINTEIGCEDVQINVSGEEAENYIDPAIEVESSIIPEEEEEFIEFCEVDENAPKSKFGLGFLLGLISGLIVGALCFVGYILYFVETGTKLF